MTTRRLFALVAVCLAWLCVPALAGPFTAIPNPDASYLASTDYIDISGLTSDQDYSSISDGVLTVTFDYAMTKLVAPDGGWATWSAAPYSQRPVGGTLPVLYSKGETVIFMTLSRAALIFGFEAEPNPLSVYTMTAKYWDWGGNFLGTISQDVDGYAGARLFAASADSIRYVELSSDVDYAVGAFRYLVPEPSTWVLLGAGLALLAGLARRRR